MYGRDYAVRWSRPVETLDARICVLKLRDHPATSILGDLGKGHAHLKRNTSFFWDDANRANLPNSRDNLVE
jgi:hypothetical protein